MAILQKFKGRVRKGERFSVEYVGQNLVAVEGTTIPGPYALFCGSADAWRYMHSHDYVYHLIQKAKQYEERHRLTPQKVMLSVGCRYVLDFEIQHYQQLRKLQKSE